MICETCSAAGELQKNHRSKPTAEIERVIQGLYDQCKGCPCGKRIEWWNVPKSKS